MCRSPRSRGILEPARYRASARRWLIVPAVAGCLALAASNAFVLDDAFIAFRYARNLVEAGELTWNAGEPVPVEGYTSFLWTKLVAAGLALGADPVITAQVLGLAAFAATLLVTYRLALAVLTTSGRATVAVGLLGTNYTFNCFATGGLETQLQALLITACAGVAWAIARPAAEAPSAARYAALSALAAAAILTRLDSALPCGILFGWAWIAFLCRRPPRCSVVVTALASATPALLVLGPWLGWKLAYYGDVLPNTYYVKVAPIDLETLARGLTYGLTFIISYQLLPCLVLALARARSLLRRQDLAVFAGVVLAWSAYLVRVGGGFMEFRLIVPVLPLVFVVVTFLAFGLPALPRALLIALVALGSGFHAVNFTVTGDLETIPSLRAHLESETENWPRVGKVLGELFADAEEPVTIATTAAGAIPYYSRLPTVDMLGLSDLWIARHAPPTVRRPGHSKRADLEYLLRRQVQLVLGHPWVGRLTTPSADETSPAHRIHHLIAIDRDLMPAQARIVEIPINASYGIKVLYLVPHPRVDEVIDVRGLRTWRLDPESVAVP